MRILMAKKLEHKKANGIPIKAYQKRGRKAYISRLANMYFNNPKKFIESIKRLEKKDGNKKRLNQVRRLIAKRKK